MRLRSRKFMRFAAVIGGLLVVIGVLAGIKFAQISRMMASGKEAEKAGPPPEAIATAVARADQWEGTLRAVGSVEGAKSVTLANDAPGVVRKIRFESGDTVEKGKVLVELDASVERAELAAAKSRRDLAKTTAKRSRALATLGAISAAQLDADEAALRSAAMEHAAIQAQIERKQVRAPFAGRLGIRAIDVGQYLGPGSTLTTLEQSDGMFVDFSLPQQHLATVKEGMQVRMTIDGAGNGAIAGSISAVDPTMEDTTRSIQLRAKVASPDGNLRSGMFVNVSVETGRRAKVVIVPVTAIVHAAYGDSVFLVEDKPAGSPGMDRTPDGKEVWVARQQFVRLGETRGDFVAVLEGVKAGQRIVSAGGFKLRNGAPIVIDNSVKPEARLNPSPENR